MSRTLPGAAGSLVLAALAMAPAGARAGSRVPPVASYRIEATYTPDHRLAGKEEVRFTNRTSHAFPDVRLHLYLNAFFNERSTWMRESESGRRRFRGRDESWFGWSVINRIALADGTDLTPAVRYVSPDDGNPDDRTVVSVPLPRPVGPGDTLVFDVDFYAKFPRSIARTGWKDDFILGAEWFPKLGVATEEGWNCHQFHAATEFFADFGDYDVTLTLPGDVRGRVGASGILKEQTELPGGLVREHFVAEDVHDFAWTASPRFDVVRDTFTQPGLPNVDLILFLQPDHRRVKERYLTAVRAALSRYGTWFVPYPYPALTIVDPPWGTAAGGMEYPTFITGGARWLAPAAAHSPEGVTVHEFGHQIFYGLLASNEFEEAHLDEGFTTYATDRVLKEAYGDPPLVERFYGIPVVFPSLRLPYPLAQNEGYLLWQLESHSDPTTFPTFRQLDALAVRVNAYNKTALVLASCERTLGEKTWGKVLKTYATRWAFRHPTTADFRAVVREIAGPSADDLLSQTWDSTGTIDYAVTRADTRRITPPAGYFGEGTGKFSPAKKPDASSGWESVVVVRRLGEAIWPTDVELQFEGGQKVRRAWDGKDRWIRYRATGPKLLAARVDPDGKDLLDVNPLNNGLKAEEDPAPARVFSGRIRFWAQNVLEFFALPGAGALP